MFFRRVTGVGASLIAVATLAGCSSTFLTACEDVLKERLRSPSEYRRIAASERSAPMTLSEYQATLTSPLTQSQLLAYQGPNSNFNAFKFTALIQYDAPNAFGTPIRGTAVCEYVSGRGDTDKGATNYNVEIDGMTTTQWMLDQVRRQQGL